MKKQTKVEKNKNYIFYIIIILLTLTLVAGYTLNKKNSASKKNEIFNLRKQFKVKNIQLSNIQKYFLKIDKNINNINNSDSINFLKTESEKKLQGFEKLQISKYKTEDILFSGNIMALGTAYIDFYNDDNELILGTYDGIFAISNLNNLNKFYKIKSNISDLIKYEEFYIDDQYGIKDILVDNNILYVSYIGEKEKNCYNLKILKSEINKKKLNFEVFYKTPGCVNKNNKHEFYAHQGGGGRMFKKNESILFTTGEFRNRPLAQDKESVYGKIIEINIYTKKTKIISLGHRNPQGLYYSSKFNFIISTEHGPKGGDEVNINHNPQEKIKNFGWPISSYGDHYRKNYTKEKLSQAPLNKSHKKYGFIEPIKYFVPSIGISEIVPFTNKDDEFLIGAMGSEVSENDLSLHYIKLNNKRAKIVKHKHVLLNERIRDMIISKDKQKIILFLETSSSLGVIQKIND